MSNGVANCLIWGKDHEATGSWDDSHTTATVKSARAGGEACTYRITDDALEWLEEKDDRWKALLTTWLIDQRAQGEKEPVVTTKIVKDINRRRPLPVHKRAERLLRLLAVKIVKVAVGSELKILEEDSATEHAWSESTEWGEVHFLLSYLRDRGWLKGKLSPVFTSGGLFAGMVTVAGHSRIEAQATNIDSSQVFVAMWFDDSMNKVFDKGIEPGIEDAGYKAKRIDRVEYTDKIDDKIIAEIRRSRLLVADFTQGEDGARGSVYYEAGFAHGLDLRVIFTCKENESSKEKPKLAFDTRQYPHIFWRTCEELREYLKNRIEAVIGEGPYKTRPSEPR